MWQVSYLGRDVLGSATCSLAQAVSVLILGQAEVAQLQQGGMWVKGMGCQQEVLQLDIPVDYAHGMTEGQGCNQLLEQPPAMRRMKSHTRPPPFTTYMSPDGFLKLSKQSKGNCD